MEIIKIHRDNGATGALLDIYENSIKELIECTEHIPSEFLIQVMDADTSDSDCRSIQSVLSHVVQSGYTYVVEIRNWLGETNQYRDNVILNSPSEYKTALLDMFQFTAQLFEDFPNIELEEYNPEKKIITRWGQCFDVEQLLQHAIVHVLRHKRQIERFKFKE